MRAAQELETLLVLSDKFGIADQVGAGINSDASDDEYIVRATAILRLHRPCCASRCVTGCMMRRQRHGSKLDLTAVMQHFIFRPWLSTGRAHCLQQRNVFCHRHRAGACQIHNESITFHMIAMSVAAEQDLDIFEMKAELFHGILNRWYIPLEDRIDQDVTLRRRDKKRRQAFRSDVVHIPDDFMRRELLILLFGTTDISCEKFLDRPDLLRLLRCQD